MKSSGRILLATCVVLGIAARVGAQTRPGSEIYRDACLTCHGEDGTGGAPERLGAVDPPDFTDCAFATAEPDPDWQAVVHEGGRIRGLDRHMPAFGDALTGEEIALAVNHLRTFCRDGRWPRGDLNLPRAFFTEKAFPENEAVWSTSFSQRGGTAVGNDLIYERRVGARGQVELVVPIHSISTSQETERGLGDIAVAFKQVLFTDRNNSRIASAGAEVALPTGSESRGLGNGYTVVEPFAMWGQILPRNGFLQMHGGIELPTDTARGTWEVFIRTAVGTTVAANRGFGRAWTPQVEVLWARPEGGLSEWDVVPQLQVTLSKLQHVMVAGGVRIPITQRAERPTQGLVYLVWDWYDGGFFEFWK